MANKVHLVDKHTLAGDWTRETLTPLMVRLHKNIVRSCINSVQLLFFFPGVHKWTIYLPCPIVIPLSALNAGPCITVLSNIARQ